MAKNPNKSTESATPATVAANTGDEKKRSASKSLYLTSESAEPTRSPTPDTAIVRFVFDGYESNPVDLVLADLSPEMTHMAVCQGVNIKLQRSYNTAKGNAAQMLEECEATRDNLLNGIWTSEREGGLRIGDLADAIKATLTDEGETVDDARFARIKETLKDESKREAAKKSTKVQAHLTRIAAEKATARAKAAAGNVKADESGLGADF